MARLPSGAGYGLASVFVALGLGARYLAGWLDWPGPSAMLFLVYSIAAAAMLHPSMGYFATLLSAMASLPLLPMDAGGWLQPQWVPPLVVFIGLGFGITALVESLSHAISDRDSALRRRTLLLIEYRHRSRGDLQSISSLLRLRARYVSDPAAKAALAEAAGHTVALGRIHTRLEAARHDADEIATVCAGKFIREVAADMVPPVTGAWGVPRQITTERAVALGLLLTEIVAEARRDGAGHVAVRLCVVEADFVLDVIDDRPDEGAPEGFRTRLIGMLAGQLRGVVTRAPNLAPPGWAVSVRFPILAPSLIPAHVGTSI